MAIQSRLPAATISQLIEDNLPLVQHVLYQIAAHYPRHADREELAQAATLGLVESAHRFDPERGVPFERWAAVRIRGAIVDAVRSLDFAPRSLRAAARELEEARTTLLGNLGRMPSPNEIAQHMGVDVKDLHALQAKVHRALVLSLDAPCGEEDGDPLTLADNLVERTDGDPLDIIEDRELKVYVRDALAVLPDRLRTVVVGYFVDGRSSAAIAEELGVTESRVSQMRSEALGLMREGIEAQFADAAAVEGPGNGRAAYRKAAYAAALSAQTSYQARVSRTAPAVPGQRQSAENGLSISA